MATPEATSPVCVAREAAASPGTPVRKAEESLEACLSAERKKRRKTGALPSIPAISLAPFREGTAEGKQSVAKQWDEACREVGFIKIVDHGVPKEVIERCWKATEDFFDRPAEEKLKVPMTDDYPYGYNAIGGENLLASLDKGVKNPGDLKEMFNVCIGSAAPAPDHPPPRWPDNSLEQQEADVDFSEIFSMERIAYNMRNINFCRTFVAIVSGIAAGIMGLTGILGFLAFLLTTCLLSVGMYLNVAGDAKPYFKSPNDIWTEGITQAMMSYVLFWTLFYDIVHIY